MFASSFWRSLGSGFGLFTRTFIRKQTRQLMERARQFQPFRKTADKVRDEQRTAEAIERRVRPRTEFVAAPPSTAPVSLGSEPASASPVVGGGTDLVPGADNAEVKVIPRRAPVAAAAEVAEAGRARAGKADERK